MKKGRGDDRKYSAINLLRPVLEPEDIWEKSYDWVMSAGRYVLVLVEIVVLAAFFTRFAMDRRRNDLDQSIKSKVENVLATDAMVRKEASYRMYQNFYAELREVTDSQKRNSAVVKDLLDNFPEEFIFQSFSYNSRGVSFVFSANSYSDIAKYTSYLNSSGKYDDVMISLSRRGSASQIDPGLVLEGNQNIATELTSDIDVTVSFKFKE